jgi:hypothetical protein
MSQSYKYFIIPFADVPRSPTYAVWFATWSSEWPTIEVGMHPPLVVGATEGELPAGAVLLANATKDPQPPPPPPPLMALAFSEYQQSVNAWLSLSRDA